MERPVKPTGSSFFHFLYFCFFGSLPSLLKIIFCIFCIFLYFVFLAHSHHSWTFILKWRGPVKKHPFSLPILPSYRSIKNLKGISLGQTNLAVLVCLPFRLLKLVHSLWKLKFTYIRLQGFQSKENLQTRQIDFQNCWINTVLQKELFSINRAQRPPTWAVAPWLWDHLRHAPGAATGTAHLKCVQRIFLQLPKPINQKDHQRWNIAALWTALTAVTACKHSVNTAYKYLHTGCTVAYKPTYICTVYRAST